MNTAVSVLFKEGEPNNLLRRADEALYKAKQSGKAHYELFEG